ncbi:MAG TPA: hypothetical protein DCG57_04510 [Candidatus Riflebacteria bacterium]|jgi:hypothetical protein|nr:hypothetical protein [Candidatus Riflebacteria bacterium]
MVQILSLLIGLFVLGKGEVSVSSDSKVKGVPARVVGGALVLAAFLMGRGEKAFIAAMVILVVAIIYAFMNRE